MGIALEVDFDGPASLSNAIYGDVGPGFPSGWTDERENLRRGASQYHWGKSGMAEAIDFSYYIGRLKALQEEIDRITFFRMIRGESVEEDRDAQELMRERDALIRELCSLMKEE
jgi:hypothetical protein